jgi:hypothetical protein
MLPRMFLRLVFMLIIATLIVRVIYVFSPSYQKLGIRLVLREIGRIIVVTLVIYWLYMLVMHFMN